jgi:hypothetical protein
MGVALRKLSTHPTIFFLLALWIVWWGGYENLWKHLMTDVEGTVVSAQDIPSRFAPTEHATGYQLRGPVGWTFQYVAGTTDASLPSNIPVGSYIKKQRWHLSYKKDGEQVNDSCSLSTWGIWH